MFLSPSKKSLSAIVTLSLVFAPQLAQAAIDNILNNGKLRFLNSGAESVLPDSGLLEQPFYWNGSEWRKLTYSTFPLDAAIGYGTGGGEWHGNAVVADLNNTLPAEAASIDFTGLNDSGLDGESGGYGVVTAESSWTLGDVSGDTGRDVSVDHVYTLGETASFIKIETTVTNDDTESMASTNLWVGTRDDFIGDAGEGGDSPRKQRGNLTGDGFVGFDSQTSETSNAILISATAGDQDSVLFYTDNTSAKSVIRNGYTSFINVTKQNPDSSDVDRTNDDAYGMYIPLGDLAAGESETVTWYYAAGALADITTVAQEVAEESGVAPAPSNDPSPRPTYYGPTSRPLMETETTAGASVRIEGNDMSTVEQVFIGSTEVEILESTDDYLVLKTPAGMIGIKDLMLRWASETRSGRYFIPRAIKIVEPDETEDEPEESEVPVSEDSQAVNAGTFKGIVAIYAKGFEGSRLSAKVGEDWVIVESLASDYERIIERTRWISHDLAVRIYIDRVLRRTVVLKTE